jgi:malate/lactate dehydrogenase
MIPFLSAEHTLDKINVYVHTVLMVRVVDDGRFSVYVYDEYGVPHHQPHCQVRWASGDAQVALPSLMVIAGALPSAAHRLLEENQDKICGKWDELNPRRTIG